MSNVGLTAQEMLAQGGGVPLKQKSEAERAAAFEDAARPFLEEEPAASVESEFGEGIGQEAPAAEPEKLNEYGMTDAAFAALPQAVRDRLSAPTATPKPEPTPTKPPPIAAETVEQRLERMERRERDREFSAVAGLYPELRNDKTRAAIDKLAQASYGGDRLAAMRDVYGDRKAETRSQAYSQMSAPPRAEGKQPLSRDQINEAAFNDLWKTGDFGRAMNTKRQLEGR